MLSGFQKSRFKIAKSGQNKDVVETRGGEYMDLDSTFVLAGAGPKIEPKKLKPNSFVLDMVTINKSTEGKGTASLTLSGQPIPITFVLSKQQTDKLMASTSKGEVAIEEFLKLMGVDEQAIKTLQQMGVTEFEKKDDGTISLKLKGGNAFKSTNFIGLLMSPDKAVQKWCHELLAQILKMPMEVREEAVKQFVKTIEENSAKDKENLKQMAILAERKNQEKRMFEAKRNEKQINSMGLAEKSLRVEYLVNQIIIDYANKNNESAKEQNPLDKNNSAWERNWRQWML